MQRLWALGMLTAAVALCGCQVHEVPQNQRVVVRVKETSGENPVFVTVSLDDKELFSGELAPNQYKDLAIHEPGVDGGRQLTAGKEYRVSWRLYRKGWWGKTGQAEVAIFTGTTALKTPMSSTRQALTLPGFDLRWFAQFKIKPAPAGGPTTPPAAPVSPPRN